MKLTHTHHTILRVMFQRLERHGHVRSSDLLGALNHTFGNSGEAAADATLHAGLAQLAAWGLLDATKLRLTFAGLAVAVASGARASRGATPARRARPVPEKRLQSRERAA